jgi:endoglucanase
MNLSRCGARSQRFRPCVLGACLLLVGLGPACALGDAVDERTDRPEREFYPGVNLASAEFGEGSKLGTNFVYPNRKEFTYYHSKGLRLVRIPFLWERVQPRPRGELDMANIAELDRCISQANTLDLVVLLDPHNYGGRRVDGKPRQIGIDRNLTSDDFNDFWVRLARRYKNKPMVWFGLMNEPNKHSAKQNAEIMQSVVNAIRAAGARNRILVPGTSWTGAHSWITSGNARALEHFRDPANNFAFEVHQYLDSDHSGSHRAVIAHGGSTRLVAFTRWAKAHHFKAFLGEFGWDQNPGNTQARQEGDSLLSYMDQNRDVWLGYAYWAGGPWWGDYMYSIEPTHLETGSPIDKPQMSILAKHLR